MANQVKRMENVQKHLTKAEIAAREEAEAAYLPDREARLAVPRSLAGDAAAKRYWTSIVARMEGLAILDDLDSEMLAVYVSSLARRDKLQKECRALMDQALKAEPEDRLELLGKLDGLINRVQAHEKTLLSYADKLGMTPEARVRLARKRAAQAEAGPDDDLFGD